MVPTVVLALGWALYTCAPGVIVAAFESTADVSVAHHTLYAVVAVRPVHASENDDPPV